MTRCAVLQMRQAEAMKKALEAEDMETRWRFYREARFYEKMILEMTVQQASEEV